MDDFIQVTQCDQSQAIKNALDSRFPTSTRLQCWVHLRRKFAGNAWAQYARSVQKLHGYGKYVELVHLSHTPEQARALARCMLRWLRSDNEDRLADHFEHQYLSEDNFKWALGKSQFFGISVGDL